MSKSLFFVCPANKMDAAEESFFSNMAVPILTAKDFRGLSSQRLLSQVSMNRNNRCLAESHPKK